MSKVKVTTYVELLENITPNESNPRDISRVELDKLKKSLLEFPDMMQLREIIIDENNVILAGHQRFYALNELKEKSITVKKVEGLTEKQKKQFMIKDNTNNGYWDKDILKSEFEIDDLSDWGFDLGELDLDFNDDLEKKPKEKKPIICPHCGEIIE